MLQNVEVIIVIDHGIVTQSPFLYVFTSYSILIIVYSGYQMSKRIQSHHGSLLVIEMY